MTGGGMAHLAAGAHLDAGVRRVAPVHVVVDSSICLGVAEAAAAGLTVVPLHIVSGGVSRRDQLDISTAEFYRLLRENGGAGMSTSSPSAGEYLEAFRSRPGEVFCLTVASEVAGMHQAATLAASMVDGRPVAVIDTGTAAGGLRLLALRAAGMASEGASFEEIRAAIAALAPRIRMYGMLDTVDYLARGGRVPQVASWTTRRLGLKPVIRFRKGRGALHRLVLGSAAGRRALQRVVRNAVAEAGLASGGLGLQVDVFHADAAPVADLLWDSIRREHPSAEVSCSEFTPAMGLHTGPGLIGLAFLVEPR